MEIQVTAALPAGHPGASSPPFIGDNFFMFTFRVSNPLHLTDPHGLVTLPLGEFTKTLADYGLTPVR